MNGVQGPARERRNRQARRGAAGRPEEVAQLAEAGQVSQAGAVSHTRQRARERGRPRGRRQVRPHTVGDLGQLPAQELPQPPARTPGTGNGRCRAVVDAPRGLGSSATTRGVRRGTRRVVVAQAFLVDHDLARHHAHRRGVAAERPLDQGRRLGEAAGAGQGRRFVHGGQVLTVHDRLLVSGGRSGGQTVRGARAAFTAGLARKAPSTSTAEIVASASSGLTSGAIVARPRTRISTVRPARSMLLQLVTGERQGAERQGPAGDGLVDRRRPCGELGADRRSDEVGPVRVEALGHQEVDLTEVDRPEVDRDLFALLDLARSHRTPPCHPVTIFLPSRGMVAQAGGAVGLRGCREGHPGTCPVRTAHRHTCPVRTHRATREEAR